MTGSQADRLAVRGHCLFMAFQRDQCLAQIEMNLRQSRFQGKRLLTGHHRVLKPTGSPQHHTELANPLYTLPATA